MTRTVFEIAQDVTDIVGMQEINSLVGNRREHARALRALFNRAGQLLTQRRNTWNASWTVLVKEHIFNTRDGVDEYEFPDDFLELAGGNIVWTRTNYRQARGALSPGEWQIVKSGLIETTSIAPNYRIRRSGDGTGRSFFIDPVPSGAGEELVYEYISRHWLRNADGSQFYSRINADTDVPLLDDDLLEMDLLWRFKQGYI